MTQLLLNLWIMAHTTYIPRRSTPPQNYGECVVSTTTGSDTYIWISSQAWVTIKPSKEKK